MALAVKPENVVSYFGNIVCPFTQTIWITILSKHIMLMLIKHMKFIINNTLVIVFNVEFLSYCWRLLLVDKKIHVFFFVLKTTLKFVL